MDKYNTILLGVNLLLATFLIAGSVVNHATYRKFRSIVIDTEIIRAEFNRRLKLLNEKGLENANRNTK